MSLRQHYQLYFKTCKVLQKRYIAIFMVRTAVIKENKSLSNCLRYSLLTQIVSNNKIKPTTTVTHPNLQPLVCQIKLSANWSDIKAQHASDRDNADGLRCHYGRWVDKTLINRCLESCLLWIEIGRLQDNRKVMQLGKRCVGVVTSKVCARIKSVLCSSSFCVSNMKLTLVYSFLIIKLKKPTDCN